MSYFLIILCSIISIHAPKVLKPQFQVQFQAGVKKGDQLLQAGLYVPVKINEKTLVAADIRALKNALHDKEINIGVSFGRLCKSKHDNKKAFVDQVQDKAKSDKNGAEAYNKGGNKINKSNINKGIKGYVHFDKRVLGNSSSQTEKTYKDYFSGLTIGGELHYKNMLARASGFVPLHNPTLISDKHSVFASKHNVFSERNGQVQVKAEPGLDFELGISKRLHPNVHLTCVGGMFMYGSVNDPAVIGGRIRMEGSFFNKYLELKAGCKVEYDRENGLRPMLTLCVANSNKTEIDPNDFEAKIWEDMQTAPYRDPDIRVFNQAPISKALINQNKDIKNEVADNNKIPKTHLERMSKSKTSNKNLDNAKSDSIKQISGAQLTQNVVDDVSAAEQNAHQTVAVYHHVPTHQATVPAALNQALAQAQPHQAAMPAHVAPAPAHAASAPAVQNQALAQAHQAAMPAYVAPALAHQAPAPLHGDASSYDPSASSTTRTSCTDHVYHLESPRIIDHPSLPIPAPSSPVVVGTQRYPTLRPHSSNLSAQALGMMGRRTSLSIPRATEFDLADNPVIEPSERSHGHPAYSAHRRHSDTTQMRHSHTDNLPNASYTSDAATALGHVHPPSDSAHARLPGVSSSPETNTSSFVTFARVLDINPHANTPVDRSSSRLHPRQIRSRSAPVASDRVYALAAQSAVTASTAPRIRRPLHGFDSSQTSQTPSAATSTSWVDA